MTREEAKRELLFAKREVMADSWIDKAYDVAIKALEQPEPPPSAQPEIIRCKDCKHRPSGTGVNHNLEFPRDDYKCPCRCVDYWYSWKPDDDWYCANGERRTDG